MNPLTPDAEPFVLAWQHTFEVMELGMESSEAATESIGERVRRLEGKQKELEERVKGLEAKLRELEFRVQGIQQGQRRWP